MKKSLKGLLLALVAITPAFAGERTENKTHLNIRVGRDNVPAFTTFHKMTDKKQDDKIGANVQLTGFFAQTTNGSHLAKAFGADGTDSITVATSSPAELNTLRKAHQVWNSLLLHDQSAVPSNALAGTIKFDPKQIVYGARLDYFQRLDKWLDGLYFAANIPLVHIKNNLNVCTKCDTAGLNDAEGIKLDHLHKGKTIDRAFAPNAQSKLTCAKMCNNSRTGFGDLEAVVGWRFMEGEKYHMGVSGKLIVPTSEKPDAQYLWGARTGECKWGLGLGVDGSALLWEDGDQNLEFFAAAEYRYMFDSTEKRTLGLSEMTYNDGTKLEKIMNPLMSQYYLIGTVGAAGLKPLANVSTLDVKVKARSQMDLIAAFAYNNGNFTVDLGYNLYWKEKEAICGKGACKTSNDCNDCGLNKNCTPKCWDDEKYAVAHPQFYDATEVFDAADADHAFARTTDGLILGEHLDYEGAGTASQLVHKAFVGVGYIAEDWCDYPLEFGAGAAYEIPSNNKGNSPEGFSLWAKAGVSF